MHYIAKPTQSWILPADFAHPSPGGSLADAPLTAGLNAYPPDNLQPDCAPYSFDIAQQPGHDHQDAEMRFYDEPNLGCTCPVYSPSDHSPGTSAAHTCACTHAGRHAVAQARSLKRKSPYSSTEYGHLRTGTCTCDCAEKRTHARSALMRACVRRCPAPERAAVWEAEYLNRPGQLS